MLGAVPLAGWAWYANSSRRHADIVDMVESVYADDNDADVAVAVPRSRLDGP